MTYTCQSASRRHGQHVKCGNCDTMIYVQPARTGRKFCSKQCQHDARRGKPLSAAVRQSVRDGMARPEVRAALRILNRRQRAPMSEAHRQALSNALAGQYPKNLTGEASANFSGKRSIKAWLEIGGKRHFMKSIWERNVARYLEWLKGIGEVVEWQYEPKRFIFESIQFGNRSYRPDFYVVEKGGKSYWLEVKGWMDNSSRVKLERMARYYPSEKIVVMDAPQYRLLSRQMRNLVPGWEIDQNRTRRGIHVPKA